MHTYLLKRQQWLPRPIGDVFQFFSRPENLQVLTPDWLNFKMVEVPEKLYAGALIRYQLQWHRLPIRWTTEITGWDPPRRFVDRAIKGPCAMWNHEHEFSEHNGGTMMGDRVTYALPLGWAGRIAHWASVKGDVEKIFNFRAEAMGRLFPR